MTWYVRINGWLAGTVIAEDEQTAIEAAEKKFSPTWMGTITVSKRKR